MARVVKDMRGLSESAWVSLAVKALRMGWPNGIRAAVARLNPSKVRSLAICGLFGYGNHAQPKTYREHKPFRFGGYIAGGGLGLLAGSQLSWPSDTTLPIDDWWISLQNAFYHRYALVDFRFALGFNQTYAGVGGMAQYRGKDSELEATEYLRRAFGDCVQLVNRNVVMRTDKAVWRQKNKYKRRIALPYSF